MNGNSHYLLKFDVFHCGIMAAFSICLKIHFKISDKPMSDTAQRQIIGLYLAIIKSRICFAQVRYRSTVRVQNQYFPAFCIHHYVLRRSVNGFFLSEIPKTAV
jgi:hypothetical protein